MLVYSDDYSYDILNLIKVSRAPVSTLSSGNISADNIQISNVESTGGDASYDDSLLSFLHLRELLGGNQVPDDLRKD